MFFEESFIFFPTRYPEGHWDAPSRGACHPEDVYFEAQDGTRLHSWYFHHSKGAPTILFFHGNAGNLSDRYHWSCRLTGLPANVLSIDYRGYGRSEGKPGEAGLYLDAEAAYAYLQNKRQVDPRSILLYGKSLGGAAACHLAGRVEARALILQSTFTNASDMASLMMPWVPSFLIRSRLDNLGKIANIKIPKLVVHSRADRMIPLKMAEALVLAAPEPKSLVVFEDAGHNDLILRHGAGVLTAFREFLSGIKEGAP